MIKLENVSYTYNKGRPDETQALYNISLEIPNGCITAIIGHTGSGKSTLIQLFNGLEKPTDGKIFVDGHDITSPKTNLQELRFKVGIVFQYPEHQLFEETVRKDIAFGPINMGLSKKEVAIRVKKAAALAGISEKQLDMPPYELSGGQKRRAAIAGILAMEPQTIIFDEPAAGLDPNGRRSIFKLIAQLHKEKTDMSIVFVSHSMEDVADNAEHIIVLNKGQIMMSGSVCEIFAHSKELEGAGLDIPQTTYLCQKLHDAGFDIPENIFTVNDAVEHLKRILC